MKTKIAALILITCAAAAAQSSSGYLFVAPGGASASGHTQATVQFGGGVDAILAKGVALNVELGGVGPTDNFGNGLLGVFSPGAAYYFTRRAERKWEPFVNGGYTLMFRDGRENLFYLGGGTNWWFSKSVGLRMEFRDQVSTHYRTAVHFWGLRFGAAFR
jgi:hypothetical protein